MTKKEQLVTWGLLALIAYELWPSSPAERNVGFQPDRDSPTPTWIQNVSYEASQTDTISTNDISNLLGIPQGPGGTYVYAPNNGDFFNPIGGLLGACAPQAPAGQLVLTPSVFRVA